MIPGHNDREVKLVGFFGSESIGKTSTAYMLAGRLRSHDFLAEVVTDSSAAMPFPPDRFDTHWAAWTHVIAKKIARESEFALRSNVNLIISDRTPLDLCAYFAMKHGDNHAMVKAFMALSDAWMARYDRLYFFPAKGTHYRYDEFREESDDSRRTIDSYFRGRLGELQRTLPVEVAGGSYRERAEFVYHDLLHTLKGENKAKRVLDQVTAFVNDHLPVALWEVRLLGSHSVTRSHIASDTDDFDFLIVTWSENIAVAEEAHQWLMSKREYLESVCEATLDMKVCARGQEPHEV